MVTAADAAAFASTAELSPPEIVNWFSQLNSFVDFSKMGIAIFPISFSSHSVFLFFLRSICTHISGTIYVVHATMWMYILYVCVSLFANGWLCVSVTILLIDIQHVKFTFISFEHTAYSIHSAHTHIQNCIHISSYRSSHWPFPFPFESISE